MVISCSVVGCTNRQGHKPNVSFYLIPADKDRRRRWLAEIKPKDWEPSKYSRICSEHFVQGDMILAFCLSILVGLLLGALVYVLLTWASRRKATAKITRRSKKKCRSSRSQDSLGLYRSTFLSVYRQPSLEPVGPLGSKPSADTSTFRPLSKKRRPCLDMGDDTQDTTASNSSDSTSLVPNKRNSFWLGGNGLKGFLPSQTPPPPYNTVIHAFEETCT